MNSGILLQLWKGVIQNFTSDGTPIFPVTCSDGFFQIMNQYPERQVSRQCWKDFQRRPVNCAISPMRRATASVPRVAITTLSRPTAARFTGWRLISAATGRSAGRGHQRRFHGLSRFRQKYGYGDVHHFGYAMGPGAAGDLVQQRRQCAVRFHGQRADGRLPRRIRLFRFAWHFGRRARSEGSPLRPWSPMRTVSAMSWPRCSTAIRGKASW